MKLWAVVEDYDDGEPWDGYDDYKNQLIGLFESKKEAINHLRDGILDNWHEDNVSVFGKYVITYHYEEDTLYRRLVEVKTGETHPNIYTDSILNGKNK